MPLLHFGPHLSPGAAGRSARAAVQASGRADAGSGEWRVLLPAGARIEARLRKVGKAVGTVGKSFDLVAAIARFEEQRLDLGEPERLKMRVEGDRIYVDTDASGPWLLALERYLKDLTGRYIEILCEEKLDANKIRRLADLRGKRSK